MTQPDPQGARAKHRSQRVSDRFYRSINAIRLRTEFPEPAPNADGCTCDRDNEDTDNIRLCPRHSQQFAHLSPLSLQLMVIDISAALQQARGDVKALLEVMDWNNRAMTNAKATGHRETTHDPA